MIQPADRRDGEGDELSRMRRRLAELEEEHLNETDALIGAEAAVAQARRDIEEIFHRLHVREHELKALKELLGFELDTPLEEIIPALGGGSRPLGRSARRRSVRSKPRR